MTYVTLKNSRIPAAGFSLLVLLMTLSGWWLEGFHEAAYYQLVQEDGPLEWATFWAFLLAAGVWLRVWYRCDRPGFWLHCYLLGLCAACLLIALEEISWGQRLIGYQAPEIFLSDNFQQELNLHNFAEVGLRKAAVLTLLTGYGMLLPLLSALRVPGAWLSRLGIVAPGLLLVPGFGTAAGLYLLYPWHNTGEWVELYAGLGLLSAAASLRRVDASNQPDPAAGRTAVAGLGLLSLTLLVGAMTPWLMPTRDSGQQIAAAARETEALAADFQRKRLRSRCGIHMRVYSFVEEYGARRMAESAFGRGAVSAGERSRIRYFLDPWQMPYWIRHRCMADSATVFVYSFGPDRRRQSTGSRIAGDDIGFYVSRSSIPRPAGYQPLQRGQTAASSEEPSTTR